MTQFVIVPREPTPEMTDYGFDAFIASHNSQFVKNEPCAPIYKRMLLKAPDAPTLSEIREVLRDLNRAYLQALDFTYVAVENPENEAAVNLLIRLDKLEAREQSRNLPQSQ